jgi:hypothetical protein
MLLTACSPKVVSPVPETAPAVEQFSFPDDWLGYWQGDLEIMNGGVVTQTIPMALDYRQEVDSDRYHWAIIYGADTIAGRRDYYLEAIPNDPGHYQIDEQNSIVIDGYHFGDSFVSAFMVQGNHLSSVSRRDGDDMVFEIYMMKDEQGRETGGGIVDSVAMPRVYSYPVTVRQVARLTRR